MNFAHVCAACIILDDFRLKIFGANRRVTRAGQRNARHGGCAGGAVRMCVAIVTEGAFDKFMSGYNTL